MNRQQLEDQIDACITLSDRLEAELALWGKLCSQYTEAFEAMDRQRVEIMALLADFRARESNWDQLLEEFDRLRDSGEGWKQDPDA